MVKKRVYFAHSMEGLDIPTESGRRGRAARELLGSNFEMLLAEEWQDEVIQENIEEIDLSKLKSSSIILADLYNIGLRSKEGNHILCQGTNQEIGYAKASGKYTVVVGRKPKHAHPFDIGKYVDYYTTSLEDACNHIRNTFCEKTN